MASGVGGSTGPRGSGGFPQEQPKNEGRVGEHTVSGSGSSSLSNPGSSSASDLADRVSSGAQGVLSSAYLSQGSRHLGASHNIRGALQHFAENVRKIFGKWETPLPQGTPPPEVDPLSLEDLSSRLSGLKELEKSVLSEEDRKNLEDLIKTTEDQIAGLGGAGGTQVLRGTAIRLSNEDIASLTDQEVANIIIEGEAAKESLKDLGGKLSPILKDANESISRMSRAATPASSSGRTSAKLSRSASLTAQKIFRSICNVLSFLLRVVLRVLVNIRCALGNARRAAAEAFKRCCCCSGGDDDSSSDIDSKASVRVLRSQSSRRHRDLEDSLEKWSGTDRISPKSAASWQGEDPEISAHPADVPQEGQDTGKDDDRIYLQIIPGNQNTNFSFSDPNRDMQDQRSSSSSSRGGEETVYESLEEVSREEASTPPPVSPRPPHTLTPTPEELDALYAKPQRSSSPSSKSADVVKTPLSSSQREEVEEAPPPLPGRSADIDFDAESIYHEIDPFPPLPPRPRVFFPSIDSQNDDQIYAELSRELYLPVFPERGNEGDMGDSESPQIYPRESQEYESPLPKEPGNEGNYSNFTPPVLPSRDTDQRPESSLRRRYFMGLSVPVPGASAEYAWIRPEDVVSTMKASAAPTLPPRSGNEPGRGAEAIAIGTSPGFGIEVAASMLADAVEKTLGKLDAVENSEGNVSSSDIENLRSLSSLIKDIIRSSQGKSGSGESS